VITIKNAKIKFGQQTLFSQINITVPKHQCAVILGLSGSGKSVLLKCIAKLMRLTQGEIVVTDEPLGMVFQRNALFDSLSILDNLIFTLKALNKENGCQKMAQDCLSALGLQEAAHLFPSQISGGMQKRVALARMMVASPKTVLYDEPTAGLDPITASSIVKAIKDFHRDQLITSLCVTNDLKTALSLGQEGDLYLLAQKSLIYGGKGKDILKNDHPAIMQYIKGEEQGPLAGDLSSC
jgi:phospholipid/cholesterol/gamma-HCH transport system ATP-binding protein